MEVKWCSYHSKSWYFFSLSLTAWYEAKMLSLSIVFVMISNWKKIVDNYKGAIPTTFFLCGKLFSLFPKSDFRLPAESNIQSAVKTKINEKPFLHTKLHYHAFPVVPITPYSIFPQNILSWRDTYVFSYHCSVKFANKNEAPFVDLWNIAQSSFITQCSYKFIHLGVISVTSPLYYFVHISQ